MPLVRNVPSTTVAEVKPSTDKPVEVAVQKSVETDAKPANPSKFKSHTTANDNTMSKAEWAAKDRRIGRAGLYQAALQSTGLMQYCPDIDSYFKMLKRAAEEGLKFVNEQE